MVIGLTILGFGTSATELLVSVLAALLGGLPRIAGVALLAAYAVYVALML
jgi:Ca2+/Na+ antiporter